MANDDIKTLSQLIVRHMSFPQSDKGARRRWEREVGEVYPYERIVLRASIGKIVGMSGRIA